MRTVVVVGAGATVADAMPKQPAKRLMPPLDTTFFQLCGDNSMLRRVRKYMYEAHGVDPMDPPTRLEDAFNYIFADVHAGAKNTEAERALWNLLQCYNDEIRRRTNWLAGNSVSGLLGLTRTLLQSDSDCQLSFITYNQDLMIEKSIARLVSTQRYAHRIAFSLPRCYLVRFDPVVAPPRAALLPHSARGPSIPILKLHGSLNWQYRVRSSRDPRNALRSPTGPLVCNAMQDIATLGYHPSGARREWRCIPAVVPPLYEKSTYLARVLNPVRQRAFDELRTAQRLLIFGYSFPDIDYHARSMFRRALLANDTLNDLVVIDTDPELCVKVAQMWNRGTIRYVDSVRKVSL